MKKQGCYYCDRDEGFCELLFEICDLKASKIFLCKDQTLPGRCTIMFKDHYEEIYEIPAGKRDSINEDPLECGKRELKEETGATAEKFISLGELYPTPGYCGEIIWLYAAFGLDFGDQDPDDDE